MTRVGGKGPDAPRWKGGRCVDAEGYILVFRPDHPRTQNGYVREHLLVAEAALGRPVPFGHPVHHIDGNKANNAPSNLVICQDDAYHVLLHRRAKALAVCGHADWLNCNYCGVYAPPESLYVRVRPGRPGLGGKTISYHRTCKSEASKRSVRNPKPPCLLCDKPGIKRGLCQKHYSRLQRHGDPHKTAYGDRP